MFNTNKNLKRPIVAVIFVLSFIFICCVTSSILNSLLASDMGSRSSNLSRDFYSYSREDIQNMYWIEVRLLLDTPEKVRDYLLYYTNILYRDDLGRNHLQTPQETLYIGTGDCEDYAYFVVDALGSHGYRTGILTMQCQSESGALFGHAAGIYKDKETGKWHYISAYDMDRIRRGISEPYGSIKKMAKDMAMEMDHNSELIKFHFVTIDEYIRFYEGK